MSPFVNSPARPGKIEGPHRPQTSTLKLAKMFYRALKYTNGGEGVEFRHFPYLNEAYRWLVPINAVQEAERWHIKLLPALARAFEVVMNRDGRMEGHTEVVGWNELDEETTIYIQTVDAWDDALPSF